MSRTAFIALAACLTACTTPSDAGSGDAGSSSSATSMGSGAESSGGSTTVTSTTAADTTAADSSGGLNNYHPLGFGMASAHGPALKLQAEDCRECHGSDLAGGTSGVNCDSCHTAGWREDCVFCHGGSLDQTGAPPNDITDIDEVSMLSFIAHPKHVIEENHPAYDCTQCHVKPTDVLSMNHVFDDSPAQSEVSFLMGLSGAGSYDGSGSCSSLYCHGNGRQDNGSYSHDMATPDCGGCHAYPGTANNDLNSMSGEHRRHMNEGAECQDCHTDTVSGDGILTATLHVDGNKDVKLSGPAVDMTWNGGAKTCNGTCHTGEAEGHNNEHW
ncbi:MAG: hypothetical protein IPK74_10310 [Deltaproteobacteria bacterium]|nr:hypothetical protein [Deltaproteobacteria bacterium]